jgi:hypothetical protein
MYRNHEGEISQMEESVGDVSPVRPFKNAPADLFNFTQHHREILRALLNGYTYVSGPVRRDDTTRTLTAYLERSWNKLHLPILESSWTLVFTSQLSFLIL